MGKTQNRGKSTLRARSEFRRVFREGKRFFRNGLGFYFRKTDDESFRFGMSVPKRFGKAVERNRLRRRLREIIRVHPIFPGSFEFVVCVNRPCKEFSFAVLKSTLELAFRKMARLAR